jgi:hypothetical protein
MRMSVVLGVAVLTACIPKEQEDAPRYVAVAPLADPEAGAPRVVVTDAAPEPVAPKRARTRDAGTLSSLAACASSCIEEEACAAVVRVPTDAALEAAMEATSGAEDDAALEAALAAYPKRVFCTAEPVRACPPRSRGKQERVRLVDAGLERRLVCYVVGGASGP